MTEPARIGALLPSVLDNLRAKATTTEPVRTTWDVRPARMPTAGVAEGNLAWHGCGWREFIGSGDGVENLIAATRSLAGHVAECDWVPPK